MKLISRSKFFKVTGVKRVDNSIFTEEQMENTNNSLGLLYYVYIYGTSDIYTGFNHKYTKRMIWFNNNIVIVEC